MLTIQYVPDPGKTHLHHGGSCDPVAGSHAREVKGLLHMLQILNPTPDARDLLGSVGKGVAHSSLVQLGEGSRRRHASHGGTCPLGAAVASAHQVWPQGIHEAAAEVIPQDYRFQKLLTRATFLLRHGQRRGHHRATRMGLGHGLEVVRLIGMAKHPICQRRIYRGGLQVCCQDRGLREAPLRPDVSNSHLSRLEAGTGYDGSNGI